MLSKNETESEKLNFQKRIKSKNKLQIDIKNVHWKIPLLFIFIMELKTKIEWMEERIRK